MNNRRKHNNEIKKQKKMIRLKAQIKPVFEHEVCFQFISKVNSDKKNNCGNCKHAF